VVEIGAEPLSFKAMMETYAEVRGLKRVILPVPVLAPRLAALWVGLVTPIPNRLALPLVEGILHPLVADTSRARALFPEVEPIPYRKAVELALERIALGEWRPAGPGRFTGKGTASRTARASSARSGSSTPRLPRKPSSEASLPWVASGAGSPGTGPGS
jgi:hypothetical protein